MSETNTYECFSCRAKWTTNGDLHNSGLDEVYCPDCGGWLVLLGCVMAGSLTGSKEGG